MLCLKDFMWAGGKGQEKKKQKKSRRRKNEKILTNRKAVLECIKEFEYLSET